MPRPTFVRFDDRCDIALINPAHVVGISETSSADDGECDIWCLGNSFVVKGTPEEVAAKLMGGGVSNELKALIGALEVLSMASCHSEADRSAVMHGFKEIRGKLLEPLPPGEGEPQEAQQTDE